MLSPPLAQVLELLQIWDRPESLQIGARLAIRDHHVSQMLHFQSG